MIKISYVMIVLNGEPFIKYQLDSIYPFADEIVIVEGAVRKFAHAATSSGHSTDNTIEIIQKYPDFDKKIKLILRDGFYEEKLEMANAKLNHVSGNVIWHIDVDEFYSPQTHGYVRRLFEDDAQLDRISFNVVDYFKSLNYMVSGYEFQGLRDVNRVHRYTPGDVWLSHRPPHFGDASGTRRLIRKYLDGATMELQGHFIQHASQLFEKQVQDKYKYYSVMWKSICNPKEWNRTVWRSYKNKLCAGGVKQIATYLVPPPVVPCEALQRMWADVMNGCFDGCYIEDTKEIDGDALSGNLVKQAQLGRRLNSALVAFRTSTRGLRWALVTTIQVGLQIVVVANFTTAFYALSLLLRAFGKRLLKSITQPKSL